MSSLRSVFVYFILLIGMSIDGVKGTNDHSGSISSNSNLGRYFDHTVLKADATLSQVKKLCEEALTHGFASVCVNSCYVRYASEILAAERAKRNGSDYDSKGTGEDLHPVVCSVVGFPLGAMSTASKVFETVTAIEDGAQEIDMVINCGMLKGGEIDYVREDILQVVRACRERNAVCKVILETCLLSEEEKHTACRISVEAGAHFVKTSTGFSTAGATVGDVELMARLAHPSGVLVKASGGIKSGEFARLLLRAGADRLGTSSTIDVLTQLRTDIDTDKL